MRYDFKCNNKNCKVDVKEIQCSYEEIEDVKCPECGEKMNRIYTPVAIWTDDRFNK